MPTDILRMNTSTDSRKKPNSQVILGPYATLFRPHWIFINVSGRSEDKNRQKSLASKQPSGVWALLTFVFFRMRWKEREKQYWASNINSSDTANFPPLTRAHAKTPHISRNWLIGEADEARNILVESKLRTCEWRKNGMHVGRWRHSISCFFSVWLRNSTRNRFFFFMCSPLSAAEISK